MSKKTSSRCICMPMVADLFHSGHVNFLKKAKERINNTYLIIGLFNDEQANTYKRIPIISFENRKKVLESCKYVDEIIKVPLKLDKKFIDENNIDYIYHAHYENETSKYNNFYNNDIDKDKIIRLDYTSGISTTEIIKSIKTK